MFGNQRSDAIAQEIELIDTHADKMWPESSDCVFSKVGC